MLLLLSMYAVNTSGVATGGHRCMGTWPPCPGRVGSWDSRRSEVFLDRGDRED